MTSRVISLQARRPTVTLDRRHTERLRKEARDRLIQAAETYCLMVGAGETARLMYKLMYAYSGKSRGPQA